MAHDINFPSALDDFEEVVDETTPGSGTVFQASYMNPILSSVATMQLHYGVNPMSLEAFAEDVAHTQGLVWGYLGGKIRNGNTVRTIATGTVNLADNDTNYVYYDWADNAVEANVTGFPSGEYLPIAEIVTLNAAISSTWASRDKRAIHSISGNTHVLTSVTKTVKATAGDFTTLQAAVDWFKGKVCYSGCKIQLDPGTYAATIIKDIVSLSPAAFEISGDTRKLAGMPYIPVGGKTEHSVPAEWQAETAYGLWACVRAATANDRVFICTTAGTSGASEPTWNTANAGTTSDGGAVWTCQYLNHPYSATANAGSGEINFSISGANLTVTGSTSNPDFAADGWGAGDTVICCTGADYAGRTFTEITLSSVATNVLSAASSWPSGLGNLGTGIILKPNVIISITGASAIGVKTENMLMTIGGVHIALNGDSLQYGMRAYYSTLELKRISIGASAVNNNYGINGDSYTCIGPSSTDPGGAAVYGLAGGLYINQFCNSSLPVAAFCCSLGAYGIKRSTIAAAIPVSCDYGHYDVSQSSANTVRFVNCNTGFFASGTSYIPMGGYLSLKFNTTLSNPAFDTIGNNNSLVAPAANY